MAGGIFIRKIKEEHNGKSGILNILQGQGSRVLQREEGQNRFNTSYGRWMMCL